MMMANPKTLASMNLTPETVMDTKFDTTLTRLKMLAKPSFMEDAKETGTTFYPKEIVWMLAVLQLT